MRIQSKYTIELIYINLNGALDNLAWVIHYEFNVIDGASEHNSKRNKIGLFNLHIKNYLNQMKTSLTILINTRTGMPKNKEI